MSKVDKRKFAERYEYLVSYNVRLGPALAKEFNIAQQTAYAIASKLKLKKPVYDPKDKDNYNHYKTSCWKKNIQPMTIQIWMKKKIEKTNRGKECLRADVLQSN